MFAHQVFLEPPIASLDRPIADRALNLAGARVRPGLALAPNVVGPVRREPDFCADDLGAGARPLFGLGACVGDGVDDVLGCGTGLRPGEALDVVHAG